MGRHLRCVERQQINHCQKLFFYLEIKDRKGRILWYIGRGPIEEAGAFKAVGCSQNSHFCQNWIVLVSGALKHK